MSLCLRCSALLLLLCLGLTGCFPTAETQLDEQKNPHYQAGKSRLSALDYKGAVESFERALEDNPRSALAHYELGVLFDQHENDYAAALYHYNKALKLRPNGYPAENIRQRIPACKQELVKADSLAIINPAALRETETLREQNQALRKQVEVLQAYIASRPHSVMPAAPSTHGASPPTVRDHPRSFAGVTNIPAVPTRTESAGTTRGSIPPIINQTRSTPGAGRTRTHLVRAGDTPYSISRQYQIKVNALLAANSGIDPKRLRVGQTLVVPSP